MINIPYYYWASSSIVQVLYAYAHIIMRG